MGNCLVTKLKCEVDNISLKKLGEVFINIASGQTISINGEWFTSSSNIRLVSGNVTCTYDNTTVSLPFDLQTSSLSLKITAVTDSVIGVVSYYNLVTLELSSANNWGLDLNQLQYAPLTWCGISEATNAFGDIKNVYKLGNIQPTIAIGDDNNSNRIYGDISVFGNCLNLAALTLLFQTGIKGSLESLVRKYVENEKTTGSINMTLNGGLFTFNGETIARTGLTAKTLSWQLNSDPSKIDVTFDGTTITIDV